MSDLQMTSVRLHKEAVMDLAAYRALAREQTATIHRMLEEIQDLRMELHAAQPDGLPPPFPDAVPDAQRGPDASIPAGTWEEIAIAVARGRAKFPGNRFMLSALTEEVGELARALLQRKGKEEVRREAMDVIVVALRILLEGDATFDDITPEESKP